MASCPANDRVLLKRLNGPCDAHRCAFVAEHLCHLLGRRGDQLEGGGQPVFAPAERAEVARRQVRGSVVGGRPHGSTHCHQIVERDTGGVLIRVRHVDHTGVRGQLGRQLSPALFERGPSTRFVAVAVRQLVRDHLPTQCTRRTRDDLVGP